MIDRCFPDAAPDKSRVKASFGRAASSYDDWARLQRWSGDRLAQLLDLDSSSNLAILDLGSGTGYCSRRLQGRDLNVINLDIAPAMLVRARSMEDRETFYVCGDAESLPLTDRCVDLVFSNLMIQWCRDLEQLFKEVNRVLTPGGVFLFSTFGPETLRELRDAWKRVDFGTHVNEFSECVSIRAAISRSGLQNQSVERELIHVEYNDVMELMRELKGIGAHNVTMGRPRTLTTKQKIARMIAEYGKINSNQKISATFELILGRCCSARPDGEE